MFCSAHTVFWRNLHWLPALQIVKVHLKLQIHGFFWRFRRYRNTGATFPHNYDWLQMSDGWQTWHKLLVGQISCWSVLSCALGLWVWDFYYLKNVVWMGLNPLELSGFQPWMHITSPREVFFTYYKCLNLTPRSGMCKHPYFKRSPDDSQA